MTRTAQQILRGIIENPSWDAPTLDEMELRKYENLKRRLVEFVKSVPEPIPVRHLARRYRITHDELLMLVEDCDYELCVNVGVMVQGVGYATFEHEGDYTVEYLGED